PSAPDSFVHRIGRVGRAGREGVAITLVEPRERRLLANIERATGHRVEMGAVPSVADLRARRVERTLETLRASLDADDLDDVAALVDRLTEEVELRDVALAAVRLVHLETGGEDDEDEIPTVTLHPDRERSGGRPGRPTPTRDGPPGRGQRPVSAGMANVYVGVGRAAGVRPQDLVGAITGETGLSGKQIGAITLTERFALVEVPADAVDLVIERMRTATIRGRKANVRRDRDQGRPPSR
ncbi:MAG TPA: DbpA RNA binding domain-containing protein, partial [Acidimicrobiales bacterium]|nr:DbpA RNA binding domain-containing protein [Acidimicrobiales bacterium]